MNRAILFMMVLAVLLVGAQAKANFILNGDFETPVQTGAAPFAFTLYTNGQVPGWNNTAGDGFVEIDYTSRTFIGGPAYSGNQSMEVNANTFDTVSQVVSGLTVGQQYQLSWAYGDRPMAGPQQLNVTFGGSLVTSDFSTGTHAALVWTLNSFIVTATSTTETLSFMAVDTSGRGGLPGEGNEVDLVSLNAVPEPCSILSCGVGASLLLAYGGYRRFRKALSRKIGHV